MCYSLFFRIPLGMLLGLMTLAAGCGTLSRAPQNGMFYEGSDTFKGTLQKGDQINPRDGSVVDDYPVSLTAGQTFIVGLDSKAFDPYLEVTDPSGKIVGFDDDSGPDVNSYLAIQVAQSGIYKIRATTFDSGIAGDYILSYGTQPIEWNSTVTGQLAEGDLKHPDDQSWMDVIPVEAKAGQSLVVQLNSNEFDPFIQILDPAGKTIGQNDDSGNGSSAIKIVYLKTSGTFSIRVNAYSGTKGGNYELKYSLR